MNAKHYFMIGIAFGFTLMFLERNFIDPQIDEIHFGTVSGDVIDSKQCVGQYYGVEEAPLAVRVINTSYSKVIQYSVSIQTISGNVTGPAFLALSDEPIEPRNSVTLCLPNGLNGPYSSIGYNKSDKYSVDIQGVTYANQ